MTTWDEARCKAKLEMTYFILLVTWNFREWLRYKPILQNAYAQVLKSFLTKEPPSHTATGFSRGYHCDSMIHQNLCKKKSYDLIFDVDGLPTLK